MTGNDEGSRRESMRLVAAEPTEREPPAGGALPADHGRDAADGFNQPTGGFPHERLDAYRVALEMASVSKRVACGIPRGHRSIADHLLRSASNAVLLLAEGANRRSVGEKRQRFVESRGECAEVAAAADLVIVLELLQGSGPEELKHLAGRVSAMLTGLIGRQT
jgi:four helix bundle protein